LKTATGLLEAEESSVSNVLNQFGLSKDESALFVLLCRANKEGTNWLRGVEISNLSKKGRVRTYQILRRLQELGLVKVDFSRPKRYASVSPQIALRRLLSAQESRLTELSHMESAAVESLMALEPIRVVSSESDKEGLSKSGSAISVLQGLANVQVALRELVEGTDFLLAVANSDSLDHIFTIVGLVANRPKSIRFVFVASHPAAVRSYVSLIKENRIDLRFHKGSFPTFLITKGHVILLYYTVQERRARPLSPVTLSTIVSQIAVVSSEAYAAQMRELFEMIWNNSGDLKQSNVTSRQKRS